MKNQIFIILFLTLIVLRLNANNLVISNASRVGNDQVSFEMSWENSWYVGGAPSNHDAVWIFIKYRVCGSTDPYTHALLSTNMSLHTFDAQTTSATPVSINDRLGNIPAGATETNGLGNNTGIMIRRSTFGSGTISNSVCTLTLVSPASPTFDPLLSYEIKVIGIEMVQVPEGNFILGDDGFCNANISFKSTSISNENAISANTILASQTALPSEFPKGYNTFYCMKYEITQGQYDKFTTCGGGTTTGEPSMYAGSNRNNLSLTNATPDRAQNYMNWATLTAYLDWAALRPMTELEYEKACRGSSPQQLGSFAWGTTSYQRILYVSGTEDGTETASTLGANCHFYERMNTAFKDRNGSSFPPGSQDPVGVGGWAMYTSQHFSAISSPACEATSPVYPAGPNEAAYTNQYYVPILMCGSNQTYGFGPVGAGIFARNAVSETRSTTGATYFGILEMSGNVVEQCVDIISTGYKGSWGDGYLTGGYADQIDWPAPTDSRCLRGGGYALPSSNMRICDRQYNNNTSGVLGPITAQVWRQGTVGGRGVR